MPKVSDLVRLAGGAVIGFVLTVLFGKFTLISGVKKIDEAVFDAVVPWLQSIPGLASVSEVATDLGAIPINFFMLLGLSIAAAVRSRHVVPPALVLVAGFGAHALQNITHRIVQGTVPTNDVIGSAGPYFSGGVMRVLLLTGIAITLARPALPARRVAAGAVFLGLIEAVTRLALGRHWPLDLLASFPIGLGVLFLFRSALAAFPTLADPATPSPTLADSAPAHGR